jgi:hypothetical protein
VIVEKQQYQIFIDYMHEKRNHVDVFLKRW